MVHNQRVFRAPPEWWSLQWSHETTLLSAKSRWQTPDRPEAAVAFQSSGRHGPNRKAERHVAVLLYFEDNNITAQSVNRSRRDEYGIARFWDNAHQLIRDGSVGEGTSKAVGSRARFQACIDVAFLLCLDHHPGFGLPVSPVGIRSG